MKDRGETVADITRTATWTKYHQGLCAGCQGWCCRLPVEVRVEDLVRMEIIAAFEADEAPKVLAKRLRKSGVIDHFNFKNSLFTLARRANGDCIYLDALNRRCTIYERRPQTCRNHPAVGPRPGYCAFREQGPPRPARRVSA